jgi:hypothetical protein
VVLKVSMGIVMKIKQTFNATIRGKIRRAACNVLLYTEKSTGLQGLPRLLFNGHREFFSRGKGDAA